MNKMEHLKLYEGFFKKKFKSLTKEILKECFVDLEDMGLSVQYDFMFSEIKSDIFFDRVCVHILCPTRHNYKWDLFNFNDIVETIKFTKSFLNGEYSFDITYINLTYIRYIDEKEIDFHGKYKEFIKLGESGFLNKIYELSIEISIKHFNSKLNY
jgi:hypothetical protein